MESNQFMLAIQRLGRLVAELYTEGKLTESDHQALIERIKEIINTTDEPRS